MRDRVDLEESDARAYSGQFEVRLRVAQRRRCSCFALLIIISMYLKYKAAHRNRGLRDQPQ